MAYVKKVIDICRICFIIRLNDICQKGGCGDAKTYEMQKGMQTSGNTVFCSGGIR